MTGYARGALAALFIAGLAFASDAAAQCTTNTCGFFLPQPMCSCEPECVQRGNCCSNVIPTCFWPRIYAVSPSTIPTTGTGIAITGWGLRDSRPGLVVTTTATTVGGTPCAIESYSSTLIHCFAGEGVGTSVPVTVTTFWDTSGDLAHLGDHVLTGTYAISYGEPFITSPPATLPTSGGKLTLTGINFGGSGTGATVTVDDLDCPVTSLDHDRIECDLREGEGVGHFVKVTAGGQESNVVQFSYARPSITSIDGLPIEPQGGPITIHGSSFGLSPQVTIGVQPCPIASRTHTEIECTAPAGVSLTTAVVTVGTQSSNAFPVQYQAPVSDLNPRSGNTAGGYTAIITGAGFGPSAKVRFGAQLLTPTVQTITSMSFQVPAGEGMNIPVAVIDGANVIPAPSFSYLAPVITAVTEPPTNGGEIVIQGTNFGLTPVATIDGVVCTPAAPSTHTSITCNAPPGMGVSHTVRVSAGGQTSDDAPFRYQKPALTSIFATSKPTAGGSILYLYGSNFGATGAIVTIGSSPCGVQLQGHNYIECRIPAGEGSNYEVRVSDGSRVSDAILFDYDGPSVAAVTPSRIPTVGGPIVITGQSFGFGPRVMVSGEPCVVGAASHISITCHAAPGEGTDHPIEVVTAVGLRGSNPTVKLDYQAPLITSITSSLPTIGGELQLQGTNFGLSGTVLIDGSVPCPITSYSHTSITCTAPAGAGLGHDVQLTVAGQPSNTLEFHYLGPSLERITPDHGPTSGGTAISITGSNFGASGAAVTIGGAPCVAVSQTHTTITCTLPAGEGTSQTVFVEVGGQRSNAKIFNYDGPVVTSVDAIPTAGGVIAVRGVNFGLAPQVMFDGAPCPLAAATTHTELRCAAPGETGAAGSHSIAVVVAGRTSPPFPVSYLAPSITAVAPSVLPTAGNLLLTITGTNFGLLGNHVSVGGAACPIVSQSHDRIVCEAPAGEGFSMVSVAIAGRVSTYPVAYAAPVVVSATRAPTVGGATTIRGSNFGLAPVVTIGGRACAGVVRNAAHTEIVCQAPAGSGVSNELVVTAGGRASEPIAFAYDAPQLMNVSPASGHATIGGAIATLTGVNFGPTPGTITVGGVTAPLGTIYTHDRADFVVPPGEGRGVAVVLTIGGQTSNTLLIDYAPPSIHAISPLAAPAGATLTIQGTNFGQSPAIVTIGGNVCNAISQTHTTIECTVPAGTGENVPVVVTSAAQSSNTMFFSYVTVQGNRPTIDVSPKNINFGKQPVGEWSAPVTVTITNRSNFPISLAQVISHDPSFEVRGVSVTPIAPGGTTTFEVAFRPASAGQHETTIEVILAGSSSPDEVLRARGTGQRQKKN